MKSPWTTSDYTTIEELEKHLTVSTYRVVNRNSLEELTIKQSSQAGCTLLSTERRILRQLKESNLTANGFPTILSSTINYLGSELTTDVLGPTLKALLKGRLHRLSDTSTYDIMI